MGSCLLIQFFFWSWTLVTCSMCRFFCKLFCWGLFFKWRFSFWDQRHWQHRIQGSVMNSPLGRKTGTPVSVSCFSIWEAWNDWFLNLLPSFVADYFARNERLCRKKYRLRTSASDFDPFPQHQRRLADISKVCLTILGHYALKYWILSY